MHPLGQRRIYALRREPLRELAAWLGTLEDDHPSEDVLVRYQAAIEAERARDPADTSRTFTFTRRLRAPRATVRDGWTTADGVRRWWFPAHFTVAGCDVEPVADGALRIVLAEGDGTRHVAAGRFHALDRPSALSFDLAPLGPGDVPLFSASHDVRLTRRGAGTELALTIEVTGAGPEAAPAVAGIGLGGWEQLLDQLAVVVAGG
jgi:uncharacterized protein YndB with AHSA1/START domain